MTDAEKPKKPPMTDAEKQRAYRERNRKKELQLMNEARFARQAKIAICKGVNKDRLPHWIVEEEGKELERLLHWISGNDKPPNKKSPKFK
jgi:hypothetical protein